MKHTSCPNIQHGSLSSIAAFRPCSNKTFKSPMLTLEAHWQGGPQCFGSPYICAIGDTVTGGAHLACTRCPLSPRGVLVPPWLPPTVASANPASLEFTAPCLLITPLPACLPSLSACLPACLLACLPACRGEGHPGVPGVPRLLQCAGGGGGSVWAEAGAGLWRPAAGGAV